MNLPYLICGGLFAALCLITLVICASPERMKQFSMAMIGAFLVWIIAAILMMLIPAPVSKMPQFLGIFLIADLAVCMLGFDAYVIMTARKTDVNGQ